MEFRNVDELKESSNRSEESKTEAERMYFGCGNEPEDSELKNIHGQPKDGRTVAPKPSDVRNGDLVSLLLAATPPYLYNIPLVPQTFFFSEMLKSFVQAKTERQNLKAQQSHHRRQRKRTWREMTPPKPMVYEARDKPLELTTTKHIDEKPKMVEKSPVKKYHLDGVGMEKRHQSSTDFGSSNFTVEKLANSSTTSGSDSNNIGLSPGDVLPPAPPLWYPLLYPPHPPYGIDPLHFFIDLRVSAHFWDRKLATENINNETTLPTPPPLNLHGGNERDERKSAPTTDSPLGRSRHNSAFSVPTTRRETSPPKEKTVVGAKKSSQNVHYVISSLKDIYRALDERENKESRKEKGKEEDEKKCKDLRALIGLELVVDYVKHESDDDDNDDDDDDDDNKSDGSNADQGSQCPTICLDE